MLDEIQKLSVKVESGKIDNCYSIIECLFNLSSTDIEILQYVRDDQGISIKDLTKEIRKDRSTIQRSLDKLISCRLCYKEKKSGTPRGYVYYYYRLPLKDILKRINKHIDDCYKNIKKILAHQEKSL